MTPVAQLIHDMRMSRVREGLRRDLVRFVSDLNDTHRIDTAIRTAEAAMARKRAAESKEGQRP
jgi:hypothetical protein